MSHDISAPLFPELHVELTPYADKPMACMAMVRRLLQKAGHHDEARRFTSQALASSPEEILEIARRLVRID